MYSILEKNDPWLILSILYDPLILFPIINLISEVLPRHRNATLQCLRNRALYYATFLPFL